MWTVCTDVHASATLPIASAVSRPRAGADASPACESVNATAARLAAPAAIRTLSAAMGEASSVRASLLVAAGSARATLVQTQAMKTSAATSAAHNAATAHDTPFASAITAAAQPQAAPAITRVAASPGRSMRALGVPRSRARLTRATVDAAGETPMSKGDRLRRKKGRKRQERADVARPPDVP